MNCWIGEFIEETNILQISYSIKMIAYIDIFLHYCNNEIEFHAPLFKIMKSQYRPECREPQLRTKTTRVYP